AATIFLGEPAIPVCTPGYVPADPREAMVPIHSVAPRFFETLRSAIVAGRELSWADGVTPERPRGALVGVVNQAFAHPFFAGRNRLERRFGPNCPSSPTSFRVVGVVADSKNTPRQASPPRLYLAMGGTINVVTLILRTAGRPEAMIPVVRRAMTELDASVP